MKTKNLVKVVKEMYQGFASESILTVTEEGNGYRLTEELSNGDAGIMLFFPDDAMKTGVTFNHGWKMNRGHLGVSCDVLIEILQLYKVPIGVDGSILITKSKSYE